MFANKRILLIILLLGLAGLIIVSCTNDISSKIDLIFTEYNEPDVPGASVIVIKEGKILYKKGYGLANLKTGEKCSEYTNYRLASVTKQFTAMCILILKERGKLAYEDKLTDVFPDFPDYGKKITLRNLLQHTSGLIAYEDLIPENQNEQVKDVDVLQFMMQMDSTYFEPGTKYRYSNSGYAVLAMIVEKISGKSFAGFLNDNIFKPLGMKNTVAHQKGISTVKNRAFGYKSPADGFEDSDQSITSAVLGDGGIYISVMNYYKWDQALYTDKLVSLNTIQEAFTPGRLKDGSLIETGYGFGWFTGTVKGVKWVGHGGSTCGFRTYSLRIPELKFTVVVLINRREPPSAQYAYKVANIYTDDLFINLIEN